MLSVELAAEQGLMRGTPGIAWSVAENGVETAR